jgi:hypothetical protein
VMLAGEGTSERLQIMIEWVGGDHHRAHHEPP